MNARECAAGLPDSVRRAIESDPAVRRRREGGMELEQILSSSEWAAEWASRADRLLKEALRRIMLRYGASAFEEEKSEEEAIRDGRWTGAEWRVALAGLRLAGVLFAVRKPWGDRLYYVPADMAAIWQRLLLPTGAEPLNLQETGEVAAGAYPFRLPLSLELLSVWADIRRTAVALTAKGAVSKPSAAKIGSAMRLTAEEVEAFGLAHAHRDQLPASVALALDLGLRTGVLSRREREISVSFARADVWMNRSVQAADAELHRLAMCAYAAHDPGRLMAASAVSGCRAFSWYRDRDIVRIGIAPGAWEAWLHLLVAFGWAERGIYRGEAVFRLLTELSDERTRTSGPYAAATEERVAVMPDGEIYVPPGVGMQVRWRLESVCERVTADRLFVYRLSAPSIRRACAGGWREPELREYLEEVSGSELPGPVREALRDWYRTNGQDRIAESPEPEEDSLPPAQDFSGSGWICAAAAPPLDRQDEEPVSAAGLFPGLTDIPPIWLRKPGSYHATTRRELVRRALGWRTALQVGEEEGRLFVPEALETAGGGKWRVRGRWRNAADGEGEPDALPAERCSPLMIVLPDLERLTASGRLEG
jgi:hypothetical protein